MTADVNLKFPLTDSPVILKDINIHATIRTGFVVTKRRKIKRRKIISRNYKKNFSNYVKMCCIFPSVK